MDFMMPLVVFCNFVIRPKNIEWEMICKLLAEAAVVYSWLSTL